MDCTGLNQEEYKLFRANLDDLEFACVHPKPGKYRLGSGPRVSLRHTEPGLKVLEYQDG